MGLVTLVIALECDRIRWFRALPCQIFSVLQISMERRKSLGPGLVDALAMLVVSGETATASCWWTWSPAK